MTAEYAALEARVAEREQQVRDIGHQIRHVIPFDTRSVASGLSLVYEDTQHIRETQDSHTAALERQEARLDRHGELLSSFNDQLAEILRRLPEPPA